MRFFVLLVAGALGAIDCKNAAADFDQATCQTSASDATAVACTATNCAFGTANVANQWAETFDVAVEAARVTAAACAAAPFVKADCDKCVSKLNCVMDYTAASATAIAVTGYTAPTTCKEALDENVAWGASLPACVANAAWEVAPTCAADDGAVSTLDMGTTVYGPTGTDCTSTIYATCWGSWQCADFEAEYAGKVSAATTEAPASGSDTSPAAIISAGVALVALLF